MIEHLETLDPTDRKWDYTIEDIVVEHDLVITRFTIRGRQDSTDPDEVVISSTDAFRRQDDGTLKQFIA